MSDTSQKTANASVAEASVKLGFWQKMPFFSGALGACFAFTAIMSFLTFFWTDIAMIPATVASAFLMITKLWDAINDPMIGYLSDRTQTKWGRYRPWVWSCIPSAILGVLTFTIIPGLGHTGQMIFSLTAYFLFVLSSTCGEIPGNGLVASLTTDPDSRLSVISFRQAGSFVGSVVMGAALLPMVTSLGKGDMAKGFFLAMLILEILSIPMALWQFWGTKERVTVPVSDTKLKDCFKTLKGNTPFWLFFIAFFTYGITSGTTGARMYFWTYNYGDQNMMSSNITVWMVGMTLGAILIGFVTGKVKNKAHLAIAGWGLRAVADLIAGIIGINITAGGSTILIYQVVTFLSGIGQGFGLSAMYGIMPDITEYTQYKTGLRISGFITSQLNFAYKASMAIGAAVFSLVIGVLGYVPNQPQSPAVLTANNWFLNFIPAICLFISILVMSRYKIDKDTFNQMVEDISKT